MKKTIIGHIDIVDFPELNLIDVPCKIDTGALSSSLHCKEIIKLEKEGKEYLKIKFNNDYYITEEYKEIKIKSSNGISENRFEIKTKIKLFNKIYKVKINLTDRNSMRFPGLIGRRLLRKYFIVDCEKKNLSFNLKK